jgi:hypothetical protein
MAVYECTVEYPYVFFPFNNRGIMGAVKCRGTCGLATSIYRTDLDCDKFFEAARRSEYGTDGRHLLHGVHVDYPPAKNWVCHVCKGDVPNIVSGPTLYILPCPLPDNLGKKRSIYIESRQIYGFATMSLSLQTLNEKCREDAPQDLVQKSYTKFRNTRRAAGYRADETDIFLYDRCEESKRLRKRGAHVQFAENLMLRGICNEYRTIPLPRIFPYFNTEQKYEIFQILQAPVSAQWARAAYAALYFKRDDDAPSDNCLHRVVRGAGRFPIRRRLTAYLVLNGAARRLIHTIVTTETYIPAADRRAPDSENNEESVAKRSRI